MTPFRSRLGATLALQCLLLTGFLVTTPLLAKSQGSGTTQITGVVLDAQHRPVGEAQVRLSGAASATRSTGEDGSFVFVSLPVGTYRLDVSKGGFNAATQEDIVTSAGSTTNLSFSLQSASLTSLTIIGNVSVSTRNGANAINTTPASIVDVPASTFTDQGQLSVNQVLNEEPGVTIGLNNSDYTSGGWGSGASQLSLGIPSVRGGLPYETESLVDGHAISLGTSGTLSPSFLSPYFLQDVEVVKGPGATSPSINYAINGTINYRTLEPTLKREESVDLGMDQYAGNFANFRATGTLPGGRLSYAFDYVTQGTQGFNRGFTPPEIMFGGLATYLNGAPINSYAGFGIGGGPPNVAGAISITDSFMVVGTYPQNFSQRGELGKIRYAFTPSTTLTVTWLGAQTRGAYSGIAPPYSSSTFSFTPPAGYTGALPAGPEPGFFGPCSNNLSIQESNLFETEFHTPLGKTATLLMRQYTSTIHSFIGGPGDSGATAGGFDSVTGPVYGGVYFGNSTTPTLFNGQVATLTENFSLECRTYDRLDGYTAEIDKQAGNNLLSLSYDEEKTSTYKEGTNCDVFNVIVPGRSSQTFQSVMGRVQFELGPRVNGTLSDNFGSYTDVYSQDGGLTFQSATHTYEAPRVSLTWRPNANQSVRASIGTSIAPPYIGLLNNAVGFTAAGYNPVLYYTETANSGDVLPETAVGFDVGFDTRLHSPYTVLSVDGYQTLLHNQFLNTTTLDGTHTCTNPGYAYYGETAPLYVSKTANLGHSEYEGIELSLHRTPPTGWGYRIQGSLQRAFVYDLPAGFYDTPTGPNTVNLGILPNINFQTSGYGYNGISDASVPYSTGYGEINYRGHNGQYFLLGLTYYGPNNSYNNPAFEVITASYNQPLTRRASLQLSIYNLTNAYPNFFFPNANFTNSGINVPLVNGQIGAAYPNIIGPSTARLTLHVDM